MADTTVSVVIPCFNHGEFLAEAVASVTEIGRDDIELIVVDDGSTDEETQRRIGRLQDGGVCVLRQANRGPSAARNAGIAISKGKYILPLDADNRLRPAYFDRGLQVLERNPQVGVVYGDAQYAGNLTERWHVGVFDQARLLQNNFIDTCAIYRRLIWEQNGGYDETPLIQGLEDWDFWLGALEHGWQFAYFPEILFEYRLRDGSMRTRTIGLEAQINEFILMKHRTLYRKGYSQLLARYEELSNEKESARATSRNLYRLIKLRLKSRLFNTVRP